MSINLVSLASQYLTPELIGRIATSLGVDRTLLGKAVTALAPTLLRILSGLASTPAGARRLASTIEQTDPNILESLESAIGGSGQQSLVKEGVSTLELLLGGGSAVSALVAAVSKFAGIGKEAGTSLTGLLAPAVLGLLRKEQAAQGLDASGLAQLLASQKENISAAVPPEFGKLLSAAGAPGFESAAPQAPKVTRSSATPAASESASRSFSRLGLIAAAIAAAALVAWWFIGNRPAEVVEQTKTAAGQIAQNLSVDGVDLRSSVQTALAGLKTALQGVSDTASAQAALPQLQKESAEFQKIQDLASKLPVDAKGVLANLVASVRPAIDELFDKVLAIPGVSAIAKPVIDGLRTELDALGKAKA